MLKQGLRVVSLLALTLLGTVLLERRPTNADEWQPVTPEELKMTSVPEAPGAAAVILYRQVDRDDGQNGHQTDYVRIKILTEEGKKYGNIEIPFFKGEGAVHSIRARSIRPDGTIAGFDGKVYEQTIVKAKGVKYLAKTFTLPDVQVGSIIEYRYTTDFEEGFVFDSHWVLSNELFTRRAKFSLKPYPQFTVRWSWPVGLPPGTNPPREEGLNIRMDAQNVPAFLVEDYMPPENSLKFRVDFIYSNEVIAEKDPAKFWKQQGKKSYDSVEGFLNKKKAMEQALGEIVSNGDSPEAKLQKIYARVQQLRNTSYEKEKTEQELKREKQKDVNNVEDVWKRGYGNGRQITWLFVGLARAAGLETYPVLVSRRSEGFFNPALMNPYQLNDNVALVKLNGKDSFFDPGTAFTPYGLLPWWETGVTGMMLTKDGGSWVTTTLPNSAASKTERKADLKLSSEGLLEGKLTVTYSGLEALWMRMDERNEDETTRKRFLEDRVKECVPTGIEIELMNKPDWSSSSPNLVAEYSLKVPGWITGAGKRALMPVGLFSSTEKQVFDHAARNYAVYFQYPYEKNDVISVELPLGWKLGSLPAPQNQDAKAAVYILKAEDKNGALQVTRTLRSDLFMVPKESYPVLRQFFQVVRTGDEEQIILQPGM
ncbi:MAG TPA: DUF3857 domain-containing protein [Candidatus Acidoferrum sp.]|nr:DUF3857 domain-containing protein [Candidatus Acidoferrum sp.]